VMMLVEDALDRSLPCGGLAPPSWFGRNPSAMTGRSTRDARLKDHASVHLASRFGRPKPWSEGAQAPIVPSQRQREFAIRHRKSADTGDVRSNRSSGLASSVRPDLPAGR
jgi:hypothetical protein